MGFVNPLALIFGLLALPIVLLYMLRLRRRSEVVSSTLLWRELTQDREANAPWRRPRPNLLMALQVAALAALVLALARPYLRLPGLSQGSTIVLLDASASMQATDGDELGTTRFEAAKEEVARQVDRMSGDDRMTLISVGRQPQALVASSADRPLLRQALASAQATAAPADWPAAFALAAGSAQGIAEPRFLIVSDGNLPDGLPLLPGNVAFSVVGNSGENLAIAAIASRESADGSTLLVSVANEGPVTMPALLSLRLDGRLFDARRIILPPGGRSDESWVLPTAATEINAELTPQDGASDFLPLDNRAWAVRSPEDRRITILESPGNLFLEQVLGLLPGLDLQRSIRPGGADIGPADLVILDSVPVPDTLPAAPILFINPQPGEANPALQVGEVFTPTIVTRQVEHSLLAFTDWETVNVRVARGMSATGLEPLIETDAGPLLLAGEIDGRRIVILPFDLRDSDLPLQIAFPIIMANIANWLNPGRAVAAERGMEPGAPVMLTLNADTTALEITRPDGTVWRGEADVGEPSLVYAETDLSGIYRVAEVSADGITRPSGAFAVNFVDAAESRITPRPELTLGGSQTSVDTAGVESRRELWPWLVAIGFGLLMAEWWLSHPTRPARPRVKLQ